MAGHAAHGGVISAGEVANFRTFDLDDPRAQIRELAGGEGRGHRLLQRYHGNSLEWKHSVRPRQPEHVLGEVSKNQVGGDGRDLIETGLAEFPFDVIFFGKPEPAMGLDRGVGGFP